MLESQYHLSRRFDAGIEVTCDGVDPWVRSRLLVLLLLDAEYRFRYQEEETVDLVPTGYMMAVHWSRIVSRWASL